MPTPTGVLEAWDWLSLAGLTPPGDHADPERRAEAAVAWCLVLADLDDRALMGACVRHIRAGDRDASFWPKPGRLLSLVTDPSATSGEAAFGRLLELVGRHGATAVPLHPDDPEPYRLAPGGWEEAARCKGVEAAGGWREVCDGDRAAARARYLARHEIARERFRAHFEREVDNPRRAQLRAVGLGHVEPWHEMTDPLWAWREVEALADEHGADCPPLMAGEPDRFRLDPDPAIERAMWSGLCALGGWDAIRKMQLRDESGAEPDALRFARRTFAGRYEATIERARQDGEYRPGAVVDLRARLEARRPPALTDRARGGGR